MPDSATSKPALLCVVPPYTINEPPAGLAYLLAYARSRGCHDFGFLDLRLGVPDAYAPTYYHTGLFGECYVMDIPDLPLLLRLIVNYDNGVGLLQDLPLSSEPYCRERGIPAAYVEQYLRCADAYLEHAANRIAGVRLVGLSTWTSNLLTTLLFAAHLKRLPRPPVIVLGGPQVTESRASAALALRSRLVDVICTSEGESALMDIYSNVERGGAAAGSPLPGTAILGSGGEILYGPKRPLLPILDIPIPAFDQMPLRSYHEDGLRSLPYHLSRGCTDRCVFCSEWKFWERFRPGGALETIEGVKKLQKDYGAEEISFTDSLVNGHPARLRQFAESLLSERIDIKWNGFMRANMDPETARLLKRSGCDSVFIGIESMSDETLALMKKRRTEAHNVSALHAFLDAGIQVTAGLIPGFPKDERIAFIHTAERLRGLQRTYKGLLAINVEPFIISPAQPLFANLADFGLHGLAWDEQILDLAPKYRDITQTMFCSVEGSNQGIERIGRLRIAESMESDAIERTDPFNYKGDEILSASQFEFSHLHRGWFLARIKGPAAWIYSAIVTQQEKDDLEEESFVDLWGDEPEAQRTRRKLRRIASAHIIKPSHFPSLPQGGYSRRRTLSTTYRLAAHVIARAGGSDVGRRVFVADFADAMWKLAPRWQGKLIAALHRSPHTAEGVKKVLHRAGCKVEFGRCLKAIDELVEEGMVLMSAPSVEEAAPIQSPLHERSSSVPVEAALAG